MSMIYRCAPEAYFKMLAYVYEIKPLVTAGNAPWVSSGSVKFNWKNIWHLCLGVLSCCVLAHSIIILWRPRCVWVCVYMHICVSAVGRITEWIMSCSVAGRRNGSITRYVQDCRRTAQRGERSAHKLTFWFWRARMCGWQEPEMERRKMTRPRYSERKVQVLAPALDSFGRVFSWFFFKEFYIYCHFSVSFSSSQPWDNQALTEEWKPSVFNWQFYSFVGA